MSMPVMDGWELAARLRERFGGSIPIIVVTAAENAQRWAEEVSAAAWVSKPFELDHLLDRIRTTLGAPDRETAGAPR
jgi:two-component system, chemotaxis family, chemotaxis protein CheY